MNISDILLFSGLLIAIVAELYVKFSYNKYKKINSSKEKTGFDVARLILDSNGLSDVYITEVRGTLTDHYDPKRKVVRLSTEVYHGNSLSSISVAAHEVGHAIQDKEGYAFMRFRSMIYPIVNFASKTGYFSIIIAILFGSIRFLWVGIIMELAVLAFELVTLPVEFNASERAKKNLNKYRLVTNEELDSCSSMLKAAAFTYVASVLTTILQIIRLISFTRDN